MTIWYIIDILDPFHGINLQITVEERHDFIVRKYEYAQKFWVKQLFFSKHIENVTVS
jgi:hypothetical protein